MAKNVLDKYYDPATGRTAREIMDSIFKGDNAALETIEFKECDLCGGDGVPYEKISDDDTCMKCGGDGIIHQTKE